jgi:hypothetical protein
MTATLADKNAMLALRSLNAQSRGNLPQLRYKGSDLPDRHGAVRNIFGQWVSGTRPR